MKKKSSFTISIRNLVMIFCLPFVLLILFACTYLYSISQKEITSLIRANAITIVEQVGDTLNEKVDTLNTLPNSITTSSYYYGMRKSINENENETAISPSDYRDFSNSVYNFLILHSNYFESAFFFLDDYTITLYRSNSGKQLFKTSFDFEKYKDNYASYTLNWITLDSNDYPYTLYEGNFSQNGLMELLGSKDSNTHGVLFLEINDDIFTSSLVNSKITASSCVTLVNNGKIQYSSSNLFGCDTLERLTQKEHDTLATQITHVPSDSTISYEYADNYYIYKPLNSQGMGVLAVIPTAEMYLNYHNFSNAVIPFIVLLITFCLILYFVITHIMTLPILSLVEQLKFISMNHLETPVHTKGGKEIHLICDSINNLITQVKLLMKNLEVEMLAKQTAELQILYFQINPHFLYNTLDCIHQLCDLGEVEKAGTMLDQLATFYRIGVSKGMVQIPLKEEITHIKMYLEILKTRFEDFQYSITFPDEYNDCPVIKLILQPIVENAVYHGIRPYRTDGCVSISVTNEESDLLLIVSDDGGGIPDNILADIQTSLSTPMDEKSPQIYGIKNVHDRIHLTYGFPYGLTVESVIDEGTVVTLRLPYKEM